MANLTQYSPEQRQKIIDTVLDRVASGQLVRATCRELNLPQTTVNRWLLDPASYAQYAQARELCADAWFERQFELIELIRQEPKKWQAFGREFDMIKWVLGRMSKRYDDRQPTVNIDQSTTNNNTQVNVRVAIEDASRSASELRRHRLRSRQFDAATDVVTVPVTPI